jgi:protein-disulfide isomerase
MKSKNMTRNILIVVAILAVLGVGFFLFSSLPSYTPSSQTSSNTLGAEDAPVTIIEYSDFECPFCGKFATDTGPLIKSDYVDAGKVKMIYKHFPLTQTHTYAQKAAEASECAAEQGKFWEMHDLLFQNQNTLYITALKKYAADIGLDTALFNSCLDSGAMAERVRADIDEGRRRGVSSTPLFFVNGVKISGAQPYSVFKSTIDSELRKSGIA